MKQLPPLSPQYNCVAMPSCRRLPVHWTRQADALALANAGSSMAARIAMMAMTTSSSINVKARCFMVVARRRRRGQPGLVQQQLRLFNSLFQAEAAGRHDQNFRSPRRDVRPCGADGIGFLAAERVVAPGEFDHLRHPMAVAVVRINPF